jgi:mono/diheme cytochrome c family protein
MKSGTALRLAGLVFTVILSGCVSRPLAVQEANYPVERVDARGLFVENCSLCHGTNGRAHTFHGWLVGGAEPDPPGLAGGNI